MTTSEQNTPQWNPGVEQILQTIQTAPYESINDDSDVGITDTFSYSVPNGTATVTQDTYVSGADPLPESEAEIEWEEVNETAEIPADQFDSSYRDAVWARGTYSVVIGGIGGIGSWVALLLSRICPTISLYDMDVIEERNIGGQAFSAFHVGKKKTEALSQMMNLFSQVPAYETWDIFDGDCEIDNPVAIACFDNMASRKLMLEKWLVFVDNMIEDRERYKAEIERRKLVNDPKVDRDYDRYLISQLQALKEMPLMFIDARMTAESGIIFVLKSKREVEAYLKYEMFDDSEVEEEPCNYRSTSHNGAMIASLIVQLIVNHVSNKIMEENVRSVPFRIEYQTPMMYYQVQTFEEYEADRKSE